MTDRATEACDTLLSEARQVEVTVTDDLMARVLADAAREQAWRRAIAGPPPRRGPLSVLAALIGGWPALGGVLAAGLAGLWIGMAPPAGVESLAANLFGTTETVTFLPEPDLTFLEEPSDG